jgi:hypothetical protein
VHSSSKLPWISFSWSSSGQDSLSNEFIDIGVNFFLRKHIENTLLANSINASQKTRCYLLLRSYLVDAEGTEVPKPVMGFGTSNLSSVPLYFFRSVSETTNGAS